MRPARLLPTIRSRCRLLTLRPLARRMSRARRPQRSARAPTTPTYARPPRPRTAACRARWCCSTATALALRSASSNCSTAAGDRSARPARARRPPRRRDAAPLAAFLDTVNAWLSARLGRRIARARAARSRRGGLGEDQQRGARRRGIQSRAQAAGFQRVRLACRGGARTCPDSNHVLCCYPYRHGIAMKTTLDIADPLLREARRRLPPARGPRCANWSNRAYARW